MQRLIWRQGLVGSMKGVLRLPLAANATINRQLALLKKALRLGIENGRISRMPRIRMLREAPPRQDFFTRDELDQLLPHLPIEIRPVALFVFAVAWRKEEVLGACSGPCRSPIPAQADH